VRSDASTLAATSESPPTADTCLPLTSDSRRASTAFTSSIRIGGLTTFVADERATEDRYRPAP
jgi:hypothetical protein